MRCHVPSWSAYFVPVRPYHKQRVGWPRFRKQRVKQHKEKLVWNNTSAQQTTIAATFDYGLTFVSGLGHCSVLIMSTHHATQEHTNIKLVLPAPLLETLTFSVVSLKTLLVLTYRRIIRPSFSAAWRISGSYKLIIASRNGFRRSS